MVSDNQFRRALSLGSKRNLGVTKQASNSGLKKMINALKMNDHDSHLLESYIQEVVKNEVERKLQELLFSSGLKKMINDSLLMIRGVEKDEVERKLQEHLFSRDKNNEAGKSGSRSLELRFNNNDKLPITTYTKTNIIPKDEPFQVALFDVRSESIVNDGPFSSIKIQICPIKSVFDSCDDEDWTETEFNDNILHERENKEPLLVGDRVITLKNGVGSISEIKFSDNSSWVKSGKFSLGAKAMKNGEIIKEARSQAFTVLDIRGEAYKKHYPPYLKLKDDVWRLKKIAENGQFHKRLRNNGIRTVEDLLRLLIINESSLREKFGKIQKKSWSDIIEHARSCVIDDYMLYMYEMIEQPITLLFNVIYELVGVTFDKQKCYLPDDLTLTPYQKNLVEVVKKDAYKNIENLKAIEETLLNSISLEACIKSTQEQDLQGYGEMQNVEVNVDPVADKREIAESSYVYSKENLINVSPPYTTPEQDFDFLRDCLADGECSTYVDIGMEISNSKKPKFKAVWCKIRSVVKWRISGGEELQQLA